MVRPVFIPVIIWTRALDFSLGAEVVAKSAQRRWRHGTDDPVQQPTSRR